MSKVEFDGEEDKPLDPEMEKVRRKMIRLLVVSIGVMFLGVMAVLGSVVYKIVGGSQTEDVAAGAAPRDLSLELPEGFVVDSVSLDGSRALFFGRDGEGRMQGIVVDLSSGQQTVRIHVQP